MRRRGQLQTLEPIIIVIILAVIIGMLLLFYVRISATQSRVDKQANAQQEDLASLARITTLPEISCPRSETVKTYCIDLLKARAFKDLMANPQLRSTYFSVLGASEISIETIDLQGAPSSMVLYDALEPGNVSASRTYFTGYDPVQDTRKFAIMVIKRER